MADLLHLSLQQIILRVSPVPVVVAAFVGLVRFRYLPLNLRYLTALMWFILPLELVGLVMMLYHQNNLFLMPLCAIGEFWLLAVVYDKTLASAAFTRGLPWLVGGFAAYVLFDSLHVADGLWKFRPGQQVLQSVLVLGLVGLYFRKLLHELHVQQLKREPMFWVSAGLTIYCLGYLQIALFSNFLLRYSHGLNMNVWMVHSLLFITLYCCYSLALWLPPKK
ncbi:hypothetical protein JAO73_15705 [Hymenobacter sp. BT523]|uniref:hypothetical protein n=1 Tax=Hymenobacter sp. BT523 TaxID=2795725 RepID=UPI0018EC9941|nr:hypothetical protein [Hymenobacter sp. BT523]MBJ6110469.1 hypothetical protein [Hymenobacter sp. BT523]